MKRWVQGVMIACVTCMIAVFGFSLVDFEFFKLALVVLAILILWFLALAVSLVAAVVAANRRRYVGLLLPLLPVAMFCASLYAIPYVQYPRDYWHFRSVRASYDKVVEAQPRDGHRLVEFKWGRMSFASEGVIYDETGEIGLPAGDQSRAWKDRVPGDVTCGTGRPVGNVLPLGGHYYLVGFGC